MYKFFKMSEMSCRMKNFVTTCSAALKVPPEIEILQNLQI